VLKEVRAIADVVRGSAEERSVGHVLVSGMLAEQLARELSAGAAAEAVVVGDRGRLSGAGVLVHVMAGEPSEADDELLSEASRARVPVVLVQVWPQPDWTPPFVRTPFVVECKPGAGFPVPEIAARIVEAAEDEIGLATRAPVLRDAAARHTVVAATIRAGLLGAGLSRAPTARPLLTLDQVALVATLREIQGGTGEPADMRMLAGAAGGVAGGAFLLRGVARAARRVLPRPVADAAVAASATWLIGLAARRIGTR
jgi:hypothetical protein